MARLRTARLKTVLLRTARLRTARLKTARLKTARLKTARLRLLVVDDPVVEALPHLEVRPEPAAGPRRDPPMPKQSASQNGEMPA
ncbi:hypothetical protein GCM10010435_05720 [Winogradskya consettensis]|uniref:Uncharacterized protein n=1 Tax=Winogradskya consettensis TaxID=113560 RepID=A0A919W4K5_9ACTN|nr:hypothetical protein Aco04nite_65650 [Actinoplanes consettensis]